MRREWEGLPGNGPFFFIDALLVLLVLFQDSPNLFLMPLDPVSLSYVLVYVLISLIHCHLLISGPGEYFSFLQDVRLGGGSGLG